jgi:hypothetical protein
MTPASHELVDKAEVPEIISRKIHRLLSRKHYSDGE